MKERIIKYKGRDIDVYFTVDRCTHVAECIRGSPDVFNAGRRPWIMADAAESDKVAEVIQRCPTGALHFKRKNGGSEEAVPAENAVRICRHGPLYLKGDLKLKNFDGSSILTDTRIALCRCGESRIMPICDKSHAFTGFRDKGTFARGKIQQNSDQGSLTVTLTKNGPLLLQGPVEILDPEGELCFKGKTVTLCRCGQSQNMPFCDGTHVKAGFKTKKDVVLHH
ncbi:MAG: CDGSH iron-sulfur domain-containing protein [bacterium]